jgi:signal transduction histidine kinase/ActR/RegA family two-component response regulator
MKAERSRSGMNVLGTSDRDALAFEQSYSQSLEGLLDALRESGSFDELSARVLQVLVNASAASGGVFWRSDAKGSLRSTATLGLAAEPSSTPSIAEAFGQEPVEALAGVVLSLAAQHPLYAGLASETAEAVCLPLVDGAVLHGVVCLGLARASKLDSAERERLAALARHAVSALAEQQARDDLARSLRARDEILGIVAHDLRNPLNVIAAASSSLHQRLPDLLSRRPVERIMRAAQRAEHLIRDLLDVSAMESGHFAIDKRLLDSTSTILAAVESQQALAASSSVIMASDLSPDLPLIEADEERLLEVLENLLGNAVKFTDAGGTVTLGAAPRGNELWVWVKDNGPGIPPEQLSHLFDRFWQGTKGDRRGAGLGLTICRGIVEAHGGRIWAESTVGAGTTVFFSLPTQGRVPKRGSTQVASILMVDDRPENLLSLKAILEGPEYRLVTASNGEEALSLALRESFAVALIDVAMPGMDGLEVAIHMKELERSRDIPIIFITAFGDDPEEIHRAYSAGGADYLVKPLDAEIVRKKVAVFVDLSRRRDAHASRAKLGGE